MMHLTARNDRGGGGGGGTRRYPPPSPTVVRRAAPPFTACRACRLPAVISSPAVLD